jgi:hypothetical protein
MATGGLALDDHPLAMGRMKTRPTTGSQKRRSIHELRVFEALVRKRRAPGHHRPRWSGR